MSLAADLKVRRSAEKVKKIVDSFQSREVSTSLTLTQKQKTAVIIEADDDKVGKEVDVYSEPIHDSRIQSLFYKFIIAVNISNNIRPRPLKTSTVKFSAFVARGNNHSVVAEVLRRRPWWKVTIGFYNSPDKEERVNFSSFNLVWSQEPAHIYARLIVAGKECNYRAEKCSYRLDTLDKRATKPFLEDPETNRLFFELKRIVPLEKMQTCLSVVTNPHLLYVNDAPKNRDQQQGKGSSSLDQKSKQVTPKVPKKEPYEGLLKANSWNLAKIHNHIEGFENICDKMSLYNNLKACTTSSNGLAAKDIFDVIPLTFLAKSPIDKDFSDFGKTFDQIAAWNIYQKNQKIKEDYFKKKEPSPEMNIEEKDVPASPSDKFKSINFKENMWILKPGCNSNRGHGIIVTKSMAEILAYMKEIQEPVIIQKYIENPLLFKGRKFDIRMYGLITWVQGALKLYFYEDGYLRTSSYQYDLRFIDKEIHLTNEAVQMNSVNFSRYEKGNKLTLAELNSYMKLENPNIDFFQHYFPQMKVLLIYHRVI